MDPTLRRYINESIFDRATIQHIQTTLPDDAELDRWLEETAADYAGNEFVCLALAALDAGRQIDARHLAKGAAALAAGRLLPEIATKMKGDVPGYLLQAVRDSFISQEGKAYVLAVAAVMYRDRGEQIPPSLHSMARTIADLEYLESSAPPLLLGLATFLQDEELKSFLRRKHYFRDSEASFRLKCEETTRTFAEFIRKKGAVAVAEIIPDKGVRHLAVGSTTIRRSVPRLGRNEPCHCGSGKKYKHCCFESDRERLRQSSDVEGVTQAESQEKADEYLTADRLKRLTVTEVCALDPHLIPYDLLDQYFTRLSEWKEFDRAADALEKVTYWAVDEETWESLTFLSAFYGRKGAVARLLELRKKALVECNVPDMRLDTTYQLLPIEDDPVKSWEWIDNEAFSILESGDVDDLRLFVLAFLLTKHRALGILLCRGLIPLLSSEESSSIVDYVLAARCQLNLDPKDPIRDIVTKLSAANDEALETDNVLREAKELLALKTREAREAKEARDRAQRDVKRHEMELTRRSEAEAGKARSLQEDDALREARRKQQRYEQELREKNAEIKAMEHVVHQKELEVEALRSRAESEVSLGEADSAETAEQELLLPAESTTAQHPVRPIEFPRHFQQRLNTFPRHIARAAMLTLGRLGAGESNAFENAVRLKACPSVTRVRIGIDHRLLFRSFPDRIEVIDLIPRQDLERKVKVLARMYD
jgi:hypothetical protein